MAGGRAGQRAGFAEIHLRKSEVDFPFCGNAIPAKLAGVKRKSNKNVKMGKIFQFLGGPNGQKGTVILRKKLKNSRNFHKWLLDRCL